MKSYHSNALPITAATTWRVRETPGFAVCMRNTPFNRSGKGSSGRKKRSSGRLEPALGQRAPVGCAGQQDVVVEVIGGVVHHRPRHAVADKQITAWAALQHPGEVFAAHQRAGV